MSRHKSAQPLSSYDLKTIIGCCHRLVKVTGKFKDSSFVGMSLPQTVKSSELDQPLRVSRQSWSAAAVLKKPTKRTFLPLGAVKVVL